MRNKLIIKPEFIVDRRGKRKSVIISYEAYKELLEDLEDLRDTEKRKDEPSRLFSEYHKERMKERREEVKMKVLTFTGIFRKEEKGYSAFCPEFEVASCGDTIEEAQKNLTEAVELYLESAKELGILQQVFEEAGFEVKERIIAPTGYTTQITTQLTGV